ncbi:hypothetical protein [Zoogloea sp.]|nr:hypothetical protein [Azovibrio sp.]
MAQCWCASLPPALPLPEVAGAGGGCYCPACLEARISAAGAGEGSG